MAVLRFAVPVVLALGAAILAGCSESTSENTGDEPGTVRIPLIRDDDTGEPPPPPPPPTGTNPYKCYMDGDVLVCPPPTCGTCCKFCT